MARPVDVRALQLRRWTATTLFRRCLDWGLVRLTPLALAVVLFAAGCLDSDPAPVADPEVPVVVVPSFVLVESLIAADDSGSEPSLGVAPNGHLFTDLGSQDDGETWLSNPAVCPGAGGDRQYVLPTTSGEAYLYSHQLPSFHQTATKTTDYGLTWLPTGPVEFPDHFLLANGGSGWGGGGFWNEKTGSVFFTFSYSHAQGLDQTLSVAGAGYSVTRDGGLLWTAGQAAQLEGRQLGLGLVTGAADDAGNVYLTWGEALGDTADDLAVFVAASQDDGMTWGEKVRVDNGTGSKVFPVIVAGEAGKIAVAYYEGSEASFPDGMDGTWNVTLAYTADFFAANATFGHAQLTSTPVKEGPICISGTTCTGNREFADYFDAVRMPDGRVAVTYNLLEDGDGDLRNGFAMTSAPLLGPRPAAS